MKMTEKMNGEALYMFPGSRILSFLFGAACALCIVLGYRVLSGEKSGFPKLPSGRYIGHITWNEETSDLADGPDPFFLLVQDSHYEILLSKGALRNVSVRGRFIPDENSPERYYPIQIQLDDQTFVFQYSGNGTDLRKMTGSIVELTSGLSGNWSIFTIEPPTSATSDHLDHRIALVHEESYLNEALQQSETTLKDLQSRAQELEQKISNRDVLQEEAQLRFKTAHQSLESAKKEVKNISGEIEKLVHQLELARKVTRYGEIIRLARQAHHYDEKAFLQSEGYTSPDRFRDYR